MRTDNSLLTIAHLSQYADLVTGIGGFIIPLVLWLTQKDSVLGMDEHGRSILNFRISLFIYVLICIPLILALGLGILGLIILGIVSMILPAVNAVRASNGEMPDYPFTIKIL